MKLKILVAILILLIIVNLATIGTYLYYRFIGGPPGPMRPGGGPPSTFHRIDPMAELTPEQRVKVMSLLHDYEDQTKSERDRIVGLEDQVFTLLDTTPVQQEKVTAAMKAIAEARLAISQVALQKLIESKSFLSRKQQREFLNAVFSDRMSYTRPPMEPGMQPGTPPGERGQGPGVSHSHEFEGNPSPPH